MRSYGVYAFFFFAIAAAAGVPTFIAFWFGREPWRTPIAICIGVAVGLIPVWYFWNFQEPDMPDFLRFSNRHEAKLLAVASLIGAFAGPFYVARKLNDPDHPKEKWDPPQRD